MQTDKSKQDRQTKPESAEVNNLATKLGPLTDVREIRHNAEIWDSETGFRDQADGFFK